LLRLKTVGESAPEKRGPRIADEALRGSGKR